MPRNEVEGECQLRMFKLVEHDTSRLAVIRPSTSIRLTSKVVPAKDKTSRLSDLINWEIYFGSSLGLEPKEGS
jgi:hypothetical protein